MVLRKSCYIRWSAGRSPRVHEVNPGRDPSDEQSERLIQELEDMLRGCVMEFTGSWDRYIPLIEFPYNNSYQSSIGMVPYEALYGRRCRTPVHWIELTI